MMFKRRPDGKFIRQINPIKRMMPMFMKQRTGATNYFLFKHSCSKMDEYIEKKKQEDGISYCYRDIAVASLVRIFAMRPKFNRFLVRDRLYQRNHIDFAMMAHKSLRSGEDEVIVKVRFTGKETLLEVKTMLDNAIQKAMETEIDFGKTARFLPQFVLRFAVRCLRAFDRLGWLSDKFLYNNSPFHSSIFFADLKSIHINYVFHHLYEFGNCGFFATMGKERMDAIVDEETGEIRAEKVLEMGVSIDGRFTDGLYYRYMTKGAKQIVADLSLLERNLADDEIFWPSDVKKRKK